LPTQRLHHEYLGCFHEFNHVRQTIPLLQPVKKGKVSEYNFYNTNMVTTPQHPNKSQDMVEGWTTQFYLDHGTKALSPLC
jgi:hypothetical protein